MINLLTGLPKKGCDLQQEGLTNLDAPGKTYPNICAFGINEFSCVLWSASRDRKQKLSLLMLFVLCLHIICVVGAPSSKASCLILSFFLIDTEEL